MEAKELRLENLLLHDGEIISVDIYDISVIDVGKSPFADRYEPIPLTEEWLIKFGFEFDEIGYLFKDLSIYSFVDRKEKGFMLVVADIEHKETYVKYVHQLQNLFHALTGEDLTIKE